MTQLYYMPPSDEVFNEVKEKAIEVWQSLGAHPSYTEEKVSRISNLKNIGDNVMYIVAMFERRKENTTLFALQFTNGLS